MVPPRRALHVAHGWGWLGKMSRVPPCVHFSGWHKPYVPRVVWVQEYPPAWCINSLNYRALGYEHVYRLSTLVVEFSLWFVDDGMRLMVGHVILVWVWWLVVRVGTCSH